MIRSNLKNARKRAGMTQQQVADIITNENCRFAITKEGKVIVCENGQIYKQYRDGCYGLAPQHTAMGGYKAISVTNNGKAKRYLVHRLVAEVFVNNPYPKKYLEVNHINGIPDDNRAINLEWCTRQQNMNHCKKMHAERYRTNLKNCRIQRGLTSKTVKQEVKIMLGRYRDIENAVIKPILNEAKKLEEFFGYDIDWLLAEAESQKEIRDVK